MDTNRISHFLESQKKPFQVQKSYSFDTVKADLYAYRRYNILGRDYFFVHSGNAQSLNADTCLAMHQVARLHVDGFYKMPKAMRFVVPNIVSVFLSSDGFSEETLRLAITQMRDWKGGECHDVFFIDSGKNTWYGPGYHSVRVDGRDYTLKKTDPTNRSIELLKSLMNG